MPQDQTSEMRVVVSGMKVFIVEDESLVAMQLEDMLADIGCEVIGLAMKIERALDTIERLPAIQIAILDVNIGGHKVYPVAARLRERGVPLVFATGYGREGVESEWQCYPILQKPYTTEQVELAIETASAAATAA
ncbi:response regulator [Antarcticirhabdus aurantiaca]|uniref:Response regulator n=1 Tax=Antarcticirhabdus aurantiaca TaxID=2606717 RepID=A0ACD4NI96_9HYPH|nr:response regulator [Antarcticirhabdus aurantiaca]WAJ26562.1 response regulator [Jeongeuplla avenae]